MFGDKLKQYRTLNDLSQEEIAKKIGTTKQVISRYENNQRSPKLSVAIKIANKLNIPIDYLIDDNIDYPPANDIDRQIISKYSNLSAAQKKQIDDFIDFLSAQEK